MHPPAQIRNIPSVPRLDPQTQKQLGLASAIAVVTGESIALGIFLTPAAMAKSLGSPLLLACVWLGMAAMAMAGALCYTELAIRFPKSGGEYVYLRAGYGDHIAFLYGWMSSIVMYPGVAAALAVGATPYLAQVLPLGSKSLAVAPFLLLCLLGAINILGTRLSATVMSSVNILKIAVIFALVGWAAISGHAHWSNLLPLTVRRPGSDALFPAIAGGIISAAFLAVLPIEQMTSNTAFVAQFGAALFGIAGARVLSVCVLLCVFGGLAALTMAAPRVCYAMANSGAFFPAFARLHPRFGSPVNAILLQTGLSLAVLLLGAFDRVLAFIIFSAVVFLGITVSTLFRMKDPVRGWWFPFAPILFLVCCAIIALLILMHDPQPALIGVVIVLSGIPLRKIFAPVSNPQLTAERG